MTYVRKITGVEVTKMLPIPNIDCDQIPETEGWRSQGNHRRLNTFSPKITPAWKVFGPIRLIRPMAVNLKLSRKCPKAAMLPTTGSKSRS